MSKGRKQLLGILIALVVAGGLVWGTRVFEAKDQAEQLWTHEAKKLPAGARADGIALQSSWFGGDALVQAVQKGRVVTARDVGSGKQRWRTRLEGVLCATAPEVSGGKVAVLHSSGAAGEPACGRVALIRIDSGKVVWRTNLKDAPGKKGFQFTSLALTGGTVLVSTTTGQKPRTSSTEGLKLADGKHLWRQRTRPGGCGIKQVVGGRALLAHLACGKAEQRSRVERIDPATGRAEWSYRVPGSARPDVSLLSAEPALISSGKRLLTLDQGRVRTRIGLADRATGRGLPAGGKLYLPHGELAGAGTAKGQPTGPRGSTRIVEIDLRDGKRRSLDSGEKGELRLVSVDGKQLIATRVYRADGTTGSGSSRRKSSEYRRSLVAVDRSDGGMKKLFDLKSDNEVFKESDAYFDQGRLILSNTGLWTGSVKPMWTAMAYTAP